MKIFVLILVVLIAFLQYKLWSDHSGVLSAFNLQKAIQSQTREVAELKNRNHTLEAEIKELKTGQDALEEIARRDLGMVKKGETFYRIMEEK